MKRRSHKNNKYSKEMKLQAVKDYLNGEGSYETLKEKYPVSLITFSKSDMKKNKFHSSQKPIDLLEYLIRTYTNEGETVLDFTMGSGSTGVACVNANRRFIGIELDEGYFNIAKKRIEEAVNDLP